MIMFKMPTLKQVFPILALSMFSSMLGMGVVAPLLPLYAESLGATGIWIGIIFAGFAISATTITPIAGRLSDRRGRKLFLCIGLLINAIVSLGYIWADSAAQLTLVRLIHGAAAGMTMPVAQAYVGDISPEGEEGKWMGYINAAFFGGIGVGPLIGGILSDHFGMSAAFLTMGGLNLLPFLIVVSLLPEIKPREMASSPHSSYKEMSASGPMRGLFSFRLAFSIGRGAFVTFLPILGAIYLGLSPTLIGVLIAVNMLLMALLQAYGGNIADKLNRKAMVIVGSLTSLTSLALIPLAGNFWQLLGICALGGLGGAIAMPAASALLVDEGRKFGMGSAMAIFMMAFSIGMAVGPLLSGVLADYVSINSVFYFGAFAGLIGTALFIWFTR
jgi:DHA1 family multidrug resistance protein-like MFS transporter